MKPIIVLLVNEILTSLCALLNYQPTLVRYATLTANIIVCIIYFLLSATVSTSRISRFSKTAYLGTIFFDAIKYVFEVVQSTCTTLVQHIRNVLGHKDTWIWYAYSAAFLLAHIGVGWLLCPYSTQGQTKEEVQLSDSGMSDDEDAWVTEEELGE